MLHGKYYFMVCHNKYFFCGWFYSASSGNHKENKIFRRHVDAVMHTTHVWMCQTKERKKERKPVSDHNK
jgi:hypothetical protein